MGHNLSFKGKEARMAFRGKREAIWHGLGQTIPEEADFEEVMRLSHLDYEVGFVGLETVSGAPIDSHRATVNRENGEILGIVGDRYRICQNRDAFNWLKTIPGLRVDTAGAFGRGEKVWILGEDVDGAFSIRGEEMRAYLLFFNSHDGSLKIGGGFTPTRVVCWNTFSMALSRGLLNAFTLRHTEYHVTALKEAERILSLSRKFNQKLEEVGETLALKAMSVSQAKEFFLELVPDNKEAKKNTRTENTRDDLLTLFRDGTGNRGEDRWDALNAVTEFSDHYRSSKGKNEKTKQENRMKSALFGSGQEFKHQALELLTADL
jgi:phage/plasmid-like protein (TIGR03299 family)